MFKITDLLSGEQIELLYYFLDPNHDEVEDDYLSTQS